MKNADLVLKNGIVHTMAGEEPAEAVAISGSEIIFVGSDAAVTDYILPTTKVIDLKGRCVTPGFIDGHTHEVMYLIDEDTTLIFDALEPNLDVYKKSFKKFIEEHPGSEMYYGNGLDLNAFPDGTANNEWLNEICPDVPVAVKDMSNHAVIYNAKAMEMIGLDRNTPTPDGACIYRYGNGEPNGYVVDWLELLSKLPQRDRSKEKYREAFLKFQDCCNSYGITGIDIAGPTIAAPEAWEVFHQLEAEGKLKLRVNCTILDVATPQVNRERGRQYVEMLNGGQKYNSDFQRVSQAKTIIDGVPEGRSAFLLEPYEPAEGQDPDYRGTPYIEQKDMSEFVAEVNKAGYQVQIHAMGDAGVNYALNAFEYSNKVNGAKDYRNMIAHVTLITKEDVKRMAQMKVIGTMQPLWWYYNPVFGPLEDITLGKERTASEYRMREMMDAGVMITGSIDYPVQDDYRPLYGMETGVTQSSPYEAEKDDPRYVRNAAQCVTPREMLACYTSNGAYEMKMEDMIGTLEVGKKADMVVLSQDILNCEPKTIAQTNIEYTIMNGEIVYEG